VCRQPETAPARLPPLRGWMMRAGLGPRWVDDEEFVQASPERGRRPRSVVTAMRRSEIVELTSPIGPNTVDRKPQPSARRHRAVPSRNYAANWICGRRRRRHPGAAPIFGTGKLVPEAANGRIGELGFPRRRHGSRCPPTPRHRPVEFTNTTARGPTTSSVVYRGGWLFMRKFVCADVPRGVVAPLSGRAAAMLG